MQPSILYLVPDLFGPPGGIARYCQMICRSLLEAEILPHVFSLLDKPSVAHDADSILSGLIYQPCYGSRKAFVARAIWAAVTKRPALILVGHPYFAPLGFCLSRLVHVPYVVFIYGIEVWTQLAPIRKWTLQHADQIISISRFTAQQAIQVNGVTPSKVRVLHNCLSPIFQQPAERPQERRKLSMLTVARIHPVDQYKGHAYVIRAMVRLRDRFPNLVYDVVGDGLSRPELEKLADELGVADVVRFHGLVTEEALRCHYANADVFIMPSSGEGFGFVFLESMAHGIPAIGGNLDATPEVIVNGVTGFLVNPTSVDSIVESASLLLSNTQLREDMGRAAAQHVNQNFGFQGFQQQLKRYLAELYGPGTSADQTSHAD